MLEISKRWNMKRQAEGFQRCATTAEEAHRDDRNDKKNEKNSNHSCLSGMSFVKGFDKIPTSHDK